MDTHSRKLPYIKIRGCNEEIGFQHGSKLRSRVQDNFKFYTEKLMNQRTIDLEHYGYLFLDCVRGRFPHYAREMEAIASGAGMQSWQIAVLNARTEILVKTFGSLMGECTVCYSREQAILGENWDWMEESEALVALLEITREDGHRILMLAEPGIIGKFGFNSCGMGVGLNILHGNEFQVAVPIHVMLRAVLDCATLDDARHCLLNEPVCAFSNLMVADAKGKFLDIEFVGSRRQEMVFANEDPVHTNHYLSLVRDESLNPMYVGSVRRFDRVRSLRTSITGEGLEQMKQILLDRESGPDAICSPFHRKFHFSVGTVSSMIMDLPGRKMLVTPGSPLAHGYQEFQL